MEERFQLFTVLISNLNRCIRKIKTEEMAEYALKSYHVSCLYYLYNVGPLTAKELCGICEEDKANISRALKELERKGYLFCRSQYLKRYQSPISLSEKGKEIGLKVTQKVQQVLDKAGDGVEEKDRKTLYQTLERINHNLQSICNQYEKK